VMIYRFRYLHKLYLGNTYERLGKILEKMEKLQAATTCRN
jgi:hypothetical protein